jgi:hypothetical protein
MRQGLAKGSARAREHGPVEEDLSIVPNDVSISLSNTALDALSNAVVTSLAFIFVECLPMMFTHSRDTS